jgi:hypothetical protein
LFALPVRTPASRTAVRRTAHAATATTGAPVDLDTLLAMVLDSSLVRPRGQKALLPFSADKGRGFTR